MAQQDFTIPQHNETFITQNLSIDIDQKKAIVQVAHRPAGTTDRPSLETVTIDITELLPTAMSAAEITAFKKGINLIVATAWGKTLTDLTGDVL